MAAIPSVATVAELEQKLEQASAELAKVKRTANIVTAVFIGGGVLVLVWRLFTSKPEPKTDGT